MNDKQRVFLHMSGFGCVLPVLLCVNLFFGWLILPFLIWIIFELLLLAALLYSSLSIARRIRTISRQRKEIIDVEAEREESS
jgi:hypothetical protein